MRALVTGATCFIGGRLALRLADRGAEVRALVRDPDQARHLEHLKAEAHSVPLRSI